MRKIAALALATIITTNYVIPAQAAEVTGAVTSFSVSGEAKPGSLIRADIQWQVPEGAVAGDTFTVDLPEELSSIETSFPLLDASGATVAIADAASGDVVFTFTDYITDHINVGGFAYFTLQVAEDAQEGSTPIIWDVESQASLDVQILPVDGATDEEIWRSGASKWGANEPGTDLVKWTVQAPQGKAATIVDTALPGHTILCEQTRAFAYDLGARGEWVGNTFHEDVTVDCSADQVTATIPTVEGDEAAVLEVVTQVTPDAVTGTDKLGYPVVTNRASVTTDGETVETGARSTIWSAGGAAWGEFYEKPEAPTEEPEPTPEPAPVTETVTAEPQPSGSSERCEAQLQSAAKVTGTIIALAAIGALAAKIGQVANPQITAIAGQIKAEIDKNTPSTNGIKGIDTPDWAKQAQQQANAANAEAAKLGQQAAPAAGALAIIGAVLAIANHIEKNC